MRVNRPVCKRAPFIYGEYASIAGNRNVILPDRLQEVAEQHFSCSVDHRAN